jgi:hypothetical protein
VLGEGHQQKALTLCACTLSTLDLLPRIHVCAHVHALCPPLPQALSLLGWVVLLQQQEEQFALIDETEIDEAYRYFETALGVDSNDLQVRLLSAYVFRSTHTFFMRRAMTCSLSHCDHTHTRSDIHGHTVLTHSTVRTDTYTHTHTHTSARLLHTHLPHMVLVTSAGNDGAC